MRQLLLKELREHFKLALIGMAVFTVMLVLAFNASNSLVQRSVLSMGYSDAEGFQPLLASSLLTQAALFCALFGTLLGCLQIRAEKHPDLWAFLVHRPIPRFAILKSKILSGLVLYIVGAGLPLLGLIVVASIPGNVAAPFEWEMALPVVAIFLVGCVYHLAGLLTGLRKARWYGSRGFGLGPAVLATIALFALPEFWQALVVIGVAGSLLAPAVWGSFQTGGYFRGQPAPGKFALTVSSAVSVLLLFALLVSLVVNFFWSQNGYTYSHYQLRKDGAVIRITQRGLDEAEVVDLNGAPVIDEKTGQKIKVKDLQRQYATGIGASVEFSNRSNRSSRNRASFSSSARFYHPWRVLDKTLWYLTHDGRLVAFHGITRKFAGELQPQGTPAEDGADDSHFLRPPNYSYRSFQPYEMPQVLPSGKTAYLVDLERRELKPLLTVTNGDAIGACSEQVSHFYPANSNLVLVLSRNSIRLLDYEGNLRLQIPYEPPPPAYSTVTVLRLQPDNTFAIRFEPDYFLNRSTGGKRLGHVKWINSDGTIRDAMDLPKLPEPRRDTFLEKCTTVLMPPAFPFYSSEEVYRTAHILRVVPALVCVGIGWWLARRNSTSPRGRLGWAIFHFLFGIPGLVAFMAVEEWSTRETCKNCEALRVVDRERCEHCGALFAPPPKSGIEIFEPLVAPLKAIEDARA